MKFKCWTHITIIFAFFTIFLLFYASVFFTGFDLLLLKNFKPKYVERADIVLWIFIAIDEQFAFNKKNMRKNPALFEHYDSDYPGFVRLDPDADRHESSKIKWFIFKFIKTKAAKTHMKGKQWGERGPRRVVWNQTLGCWTEMV